MNALRGSRKSIVLTTLIFAITFISYVAAWGGCSTALCGAFVLYTGGFDGLGTFYDQAQLYKPNLVDPLTGTKGGFEFTTQMHTARTVHAQAVFQVGNPPLTKVLVVGGQSDAVTSCPFPSAEVYNPNDDPPTFTPTGEMSTCRIGPSATTLQNGNVLVVGGSLNSAGGFARIPTAEVYDATSNTFLPYIIMMHGRQGHTATLLPNANGKVLIAGGDVGGGPTDSAEIYDPASNSFMEIPSKMKDKRTGHAAVFLEATGEVLLMGGTDSSKSLKSAELYVYDPQTGIGTFQPTASMTDDRSAFWPALLAPAFIGDTRVLVAGGGQQPGMNILATAEVYYRNSPGPPESAFWRPTGMMRTPRFEYTLYNNGDLFPDGTVLIAGGQTSTCCYVATEFAELWDPTEGAIDPITNRPFGAFKDTGDMKLKTGGYGDPLIFVGGTAPPADKVQVRFHYSAHGSPGNWSDAMKVTSTGVIAIGPQPLEGNLIVRPGDLLKVGYDFKMPSKHPATSLIFTQAKVRFSAICTSGQKKELVVNMADKMYTDPLNSTAWYPSGHQSDPSVYEGALSVPDLCNGGTMSLKSGGLFGALVGQQ